jgi:hypothetical protein
MWRDLVSLISMLCGAILAGYAALNAYHTITGAGEGVSRRGNQLDADWPTTGLLAASALVFLGLYWLVNRGRPKDGDGA